MPTGLQWLHNLRNLRVSIGPLASRPPATAPGLEVGMRWVVDTTGAEYIIDAVGGVHVWLQISAGGIADGVDLALYGDGSDGAVVLPAGVTTLTRTMLYLSLTLPAGAILETAGFPVYGRVSITTLPGSIVRNRGGNGGIGNPGAPGLPGVGAAAGVLAGGGNGGSGVPDPEPPPPRDGVSVTNALGGAGGAGGGPGGGGAPGIGGLSIPPTATAGTWRAVPQFALAQTPYGGALQPGAGGGGGGSEAVPNAGGGGGGGGGMVLLITPILNHDGDVDVRGGDGGGVGVFFGNGAGGGGGGGGGAAMFLYRTKTGAGTVTATGGTGAPGVGVFGGTGAPGLPGALYELVDA